MKGTVLVFLAISIGLVLAYLDGKPVIYADGRTYQVYEINIDGTVGGRPFSRQAALFVNAAQLTDSASQNLNQVNFWLVSGNPSGTAGKGAIWLASNSSFYGGEESTEFATVSVLSNELVAVFRAGGPVLNANAFSLSSDSAENGVQIIEGGLAIELQLNGQVQGSINIVGLDASQTHLQYSATLTGSFIGERTF
jgi:hypothetical protein